MQLLPASVAASTVFHRSPFAFAHNRQSRAVDDEMDGSSRWDAAEFNRERLTSSGERGVVGGFEIDPINDKTDRKKPSAWRKGNRKTRALQGFRWLISTPAEDLGWVRVASPDAGP